jgi:hypothetical protein
LLLPCKNGEFKPEAFKMSSESVMLQSLRFFAKPGTSRGKTHLLVEFMRSFTIRAIATVQGQGIHTMSGCPLLRCLNQLTAYAGASELVMHDKSHDAAVSSVFFI